jgi:hypothetical protein
MVSAPHQKYAETRAGAGAPRHSAGRWGRALACIVGMAMLTGAANSGQQAPAFHSGAPYHLFPAANLPPDSSQQAGTQDQQPETKPVTEEERKKQISDQSAMLLKLATELKTEVDKTTKDTLSLEVIRKADEIEKLAHGVKEQTKLTAAN